MVYAASRGPSTMPVPARSAQTLGVATALRDPPAMSSPSDQFEPELLQRIDEVLYYLWDPLGVAREPRSRQEYSAFVSEVFAAILDDADEQRLMELLLLLE